MIVTRPALEKIMAPHEPPCLSLYFPAIRKDDTAQNSIRYKNLLKDAYAQLVAGGMSAQEADEFLRQPRDLISDLLFWDRLQEGVAVFRSRDYFEVFKFPFAVEEIVLVNKRFLLKPLLRLVTTDGRFFVLSVSRSRTRLFEATPHNIRETDARALPQGLSETQPESRFGTGGRRVAVAVTRRGAPGSVHGQEVDTVDREDLRRHFAIIDKVINETLRDSGAPLVLAGVDYELAAYRDANSYPFLIPGGVEGNFDHARPQELHRPAWALVEPATRRNLDVALARYHDLSGTNKVSSELASVLPAAHDGRVHTLFFAENRARWGVFDSATGRLEVHETRQNGDEDLVDAAALSALSTGAQVFMLSPSRMPSRSPVAAILRY